MLGRRGFVAGVAAALGVAVAACRADPHSPAGVLRFANRPFFIDGDTLPAFERATGIAVEYHEDQLDDAVFEAALREVGGADLGRDLVVVNDQTAARLAADSLLEALPRDTDIATMRTALERGGPRRQVPWAVGVTGLAFVRGRVPGDVRSARDLLAPDLAGQVAFVRDPMESIGMVLLAMGVELERVTPAALAAAADRVAGAREAGAVVVDTVFDADLGTADGPWVAVGNAGDVAQLQAEGVDVAFVVPEEGGVLWSDDLVIPRGARNAAAAAQFVEFVYRPDVSRRLFAALRFTSPVEGVGSLPPRLHRLRDLTAEETAIVTDALA